MMRAEGLGGVGNSVRVANAVALLFSLACSHAQQPAAHRSAVSDAAAEHYWPQGQVLEHPVVRDGKVEEYAQASPALEEAEKAFQAHRWDDAEAAYRRAIAECPTCYAAMTGWGDVQINRKGDIPGALEMYERALELNPYDPQTHVFRASALFRLHKTPEAVHELVQALALRPGYRFALVIAHEAHKEGLPLSIDAAPLRPTGYLVPQGPHKMGFMSVAQPNLIDDIPWVIYSNCKWIGPEKEYIGLDDSAPRPWDAKVEAECLSKIADGAKGQEDSLNKMSTEQHVNVQRAGLAPALRRLLRAREAGFLDEFVLYEVRARMEPQVTLTLPPAQLERVKAYVAQFVLGT